MTTLHLDNIEHAESNKLKIAEYIHKNQPFIIKNLAKEWPALKKWDFDFFKDNYRNLNLPVSNYKEYGPQIEDDKTHMRLGDYITYLKEVEIRGLENHKNLYLAGWGFNRYCPELNNDIQIPSYFSDNYLYEIQNIINFNWQTLFIGHQFTETPLHTDSYFVTTWLTVLKGKKIIRMAPPLETDLLYNSLDLFDEKNVAKLHENNIPVYEAILEPPDTIIFPVNWWHQVRHEKATIALSCNYINDHNYLLFEQQLRMRFWKPIINLAKLKHKINNKQVYPNSELISLSKYVDNEKYFIEYLENFRNHEKDKLQKLIKSLSRK